MRRVKPLIKKECFPFYANFYTDKSHEFVLIYDIGGSLEYSIFGYFLDPGEREKESILLRGALILVKEKYI